MSKFFSLLHLRRPNEGPLRSLVRLLALVIIILASALAFWYNSKSQMDKIVNQEIYTIDSTRTLSHEQEKSINVYQKAFLDEYGIRLIIKVSSSEDFDYHTPKGSKVPYLFILIKPYAKEISFEMSPLVKVALGEDFIKKLSEEYILASFPEWPKGLFESLNALTLHMDETVNESAQK